MQTELNKIDISITKALIRRVTFTMDGDNLPDVSISIDLLTRTNKVITQIELSTNHWQDNSKLNKDDIPAHVFSAIGTACRELSSLCTKKINAIDKFIGETNV